MSVQDVTDYDPLKGTVRAKRINFKLADGTNSYVIVPLDMFTREHVEKVLTEAANHHADIMSIKGPSTLRGMSGKASDNPWG